MFFTEATVSGTSDLLSVLTTASGPTVVAVVAVALWKEWLVPGSRYRAVEKEKSDLQQAIIEKVIPAVTEANVMARELMRRRGGPE